MDPVINKTGRALVAIATLGFCLGMIVWLDLYGSPANSLHQSSLSWAWTGVVIGLGALLGNITADAIAQLLTRKS